MLNLTKMKTFVNPGSRGLRRTYATATRRATTLQRVRMDEGGINVGRHSSSPAEASSRRRKEIIIIDYRGAGRQRNTHRCFRKFSPCYDKLHIQRLQLMIILIDYYVVVIAGLRRACSKIQRCLKYTMHAHSYGMKRYCTHGLTEKRPHCARAVYFVLHLH